MFHEEPLLTPAELPLASGVSSIRWLSTSGAGLAKPLDHRADIGHSEERSTRSEARDPERETSRASLEKAKKFGRFLGGET